MQILPHNEKIFLHTECQTQYSPGPIIFFFEQQPQIENGHKNEYKIGFRVSSVVTLFVRVSHEDGAYTLSFPTLAASGSGKGQRSPVLMKLNGGLVGWGAEVTTMTFSNLFTLSVCSCADLSVHSPIVFGRKSHKVLPSKIKRKRAKKIIAGFVGCNFEISHVKWMPF